jgi:NADH-quinone oxidoreductase subunit J
VYAIARLIFTTYVFPFEVTSALLITAALGAMVLAHRERITPKLTQRDLSRLRVASGRPAPLAGPGTYARHNAVDMPALLPDGTPAEASVPPAIRGVPETPDQQRTLLGSSAVVRGESGGESGQESDA